MTGSFDTGTLAALRQILLSVLVLGLVGIGAELLLINHLESPAQIFAPALLGAGLAAVTAHLLHRGPLGVRVLQLVMVILIGTGVLGMYYHLAANLEFQREMDPSLGGIALLWKAMSATTPPALAPGSMAQLGLVGLAYTFRHPAIARSHARERPAETAVRQGDRVHERTGEAR